MTNNMVNDIKAKKRSLSSRPLDLFFFIFFAVHIPVTLMCDAQAIYPPSLQNKALLENLAWWTELSGDYLMKSALPGETTIVWFKTIIFLESVFQLPYFCYALYSLYSDQIHLSAHRLPALLYSVHVMTTVLPMLFDFGFSTQVSELQRKMLVSIYGIFFIVPFFYFLRALSAKTPTSSRSPLKQMKKKLN